MEGDNYVVSFPNCEIELASDGQVLGWAVRSKFEVTLPLCLDVFSVRNVTKLCYQIYGSRQVLLLGQDGESQLFRDVAQGYIVLWSAVGSRGNSASQLKLLKWPLLVTPAEHNLFHGSSENIRCAECAGSVKNALIAVTRAECGFDSGYFSELGWVFWLSLIYYYFFYGHIG